MDEVLDVTIQEGQFIQEAGFVVHTIIDLRESIGAPQNFLSSIPRIKSLPAANHPNAGNKVVVGATGIAEIFLNIFSKVGRKLYLFDTMDEAVVFLQEKP